MSPLLICLFFFVNEQYRQLKIHPIVDPNPKGEYTMKKSINIASFFVSIILAFCFTGCIGMSDKEYRLRKKEIEAKAAHPKTYDVITLTGPFEMKEGATLVTSPSQPWVNTEIPDGQEIQRAVIRDVITGAVIGYGMYRIGRVDGDTTNNYSNTTETGN